ncbi:hypothetical protein CsSME_00050682 [Camellia sinensis var. sinensis]
MDGRPYLTTQNQPFALCTLPRRIDDDVKEPVKGLCGYRMISMDYKVYMDRESSDEQLGVPGRVFNHGFPEFTPNVEYYSIKEYPLRDQALRCQLKLSWVIPLFDPSTHFCVGVLDIVSTWPSIGFLLYNNSDCLRMLKVSPPTHKLAFFFYVFLIKKEIDEKCVFNRVNYKKYSLFKIHIVPVILESTLLLFKFLIVRLLFILSA